MIQYWIKDKITALLPELTVTVDYEANENSYATVFYEGGTAPGRFDIKTQTMRYMVWIESDDWGFAEYVAHMIYKELNEYDVQEVIAVEFIDKNGTVLFTEDVHLLKITANGEVNPLGILEGKRRFSINFDAALIKT